MQPSVHLHIGLILVFYTHGPPLSFFLYIVLTLFFRIELTSELKFIWWKYVGVLTSGHDL